VTVAVYLESMVAVEYLDYESFDHPSLHYYHY
jgi:hypothetical protein